MTKVDPQITAEATPAEVFSFAAVESAAGEVRAVADILNALACDDAVECLTPWSLHKLAGHLSQAHAVLARQVELCCALRRASRHAAE